MLTSDQKGAVAEAAVAHAALELGFGVSRPLGDERYDLILDLADGLARVQCKWARRRGDVIQVPCRTSRRGRDGFVRSIYTRDEVDAIAAYCPDVGRCYFLPLSLFGERSFIQLRLSPTRNNQRLGVNWAERFESPLHFESATGP